MGLKSHQSNSPKGRTDSEPFLHYMTIRLIQAAGFLVWYCVFVVSLGPEDISSAVQVSRIEQRRNLGRVVADSQKVDEKRRDEGARKGPVDAIAEKLTDATYYPLNNPRKQVERWQNPEGWERKPIIKLTKEQEAEKGEERREALNIPAGVDEVDAITKKLEKQKEEAKKKKEKFE